MLTLYSCQRAKNFNPLPSCEGRLHHHSLALRPGHFNPLPSCEGRLCSISAISMLKRISIHSPHARGDVKLSARLYVQFHFNPLPSCEGRHRRARRCVKGRRISIHSPHARGDGTAGNGSRKCHQISIHSPHARGDEVIYRQNAGMIGFQSTPLMRGETRDQINTLIEAIISIHSPHARGDVLMVMIRLQL